MIFGFKPDDKSWSIPQLYVVTIDKLLCLLDSILIVNAFDDLWWSRNVIVRINKIGAIVGHAAAPARTGGSSVTDAQ